MRTIPSVTMHAAKNVCRPLILHKRSVIRVSMAPSKLNDTQVYSETDRYLSVYMVFMPPTASKPIVVVIEDC